VSKFSLELLPVSTVMRSPVVTLELHMKVCRIVQLLAPAEFARTVVV
jgi:hypothetical protein